MDQTTLLIIGAAVILVALLLLFLLRGRKQSVRFDATAAVPPRAAAPAPAPVAPPVEEGHGIGSEMSAAIEDVVDQFIGIDAHASGQGVAPAHGDALTTLKGLGPKAAARLTELGVTRFDQMAAWNEADIEAIDARMGAFKGRIARDQWVEQARLLAAGDREAFETRYGKLGG